MRMTDPFPASFQGLEPSDRLDWPAMAQKVVQDVLRLERFERVLLSADAYCGGAMLDAVRAEIQRAGAIELATILHWSPAVAGLRGGDGNKLDPEERAAENRAMAQLFGCADVFIWLQNDWRSRHRTHAVGQSELVLETWPGRSVHFHWFHDPRNSDPDHPANLAINKVYERAILDLDYPALQARMAGLADAMRGRTVRITDPAGTDLTLRMTDRFGLNDGDASRAKMAMATSARDREEEIPCGALRTIPDLDSVEGVLAFDRDFGFPAAGHGLDLGRFLEHGLRITFRAGRIVRLETGGDQAELDRQWALETGDRDRLGEFVLGCNPLLQPVEGSTFQPYFGFGEGILRLTIGENAESGGHNRSSLHRWMMLLCPTISVAGRTLMDAGRITL
jgi:hypothetical protein